MINSVGNYYRPVAYQAQPQSQRQIQPSFKGEENKKEGMSKTSKTLLSFGVLAAVVISGGLLFNKLVNVSRGKFPVHHCDHFGQKELEDYARSVLKR